jgi:hypothetical protein
MFTKEKQMKNPVEVLNSIFEISIKVKLLIIVIYHCVF